MDTRSGAASLVDPVAESAAQDRRLWDDLTGQADAIAIVDAAVEAARAGGSDDASMTHAWLITGPPGSGRSNLAFAFATALLSSGASDSLEATRRQVEARSHPDLRVLSTEKVIITIGEVRELVVDSYFSPSVGRYRVMVIEDADRMREAASNVLLKALEEPPPRTVWILCAPSEADLIPTIRSRVRTVRLRVPSVSQVAELLQRRDGVDAATATRAAREAQSHIGMAHRLATNADAWQRRSRTLEVALGIHSVSDAVIGAAALLELAKADAESLTDERNGQERDAALRSLGIEPGGTVPAGLRGQLRALDDDQKRRATRSLRDGIDRIMTDVLSLYRDILLIQLGVPSEPINLEIVDQLKHASSLAEATQTLATMDAIAIARRRIDSNVAPALALEAMLMSCRRNDSGRDRAQRKETP
jgi:DNA polymerase-3 subunit delta'